MLITKITGVTINMVAKVKITITKQNVIGQ